MTVHRYLVTAKPGPKMDMWSRTGAVANWIDGRENLDGGETWLVTVYAGDSPLFLDAARATGVTVEEIEISGDAETYVLRVGEPGSGWQTAVAQAHPEQPVSDPQPVDKSAPATTDVVHTDEEQLVLAIAHDRQPYPTADAYTAACAALERHRERANAAELEAKRLGAQYTEAMSGAGQLADKITRVRKVAAVLREEYTGFGKPQEKAICLAITDDLIEALDWPGGGRPSVVHADTEQPVSAPPEVDESAADTCQLVHVDGGPVLLRGQGEMDETTAGHLAEVVRAAQRRYATEHPDGPPPRRPRSATFRRLAAGLTGIVRDEHGQPICTCTFDARCPACQTGVGTAAAPMITTTTLPHDPYITAVVDTLTAAGLEPTDVWTSDTETDPYRTDDDAGCATMLSAILIWDGAHQALNAAELPDGITLIWEHPAENWQWGERGPHGVLRQEPEFLPALGRYADPSGVADVVRALLADTQVPDGHAPYWHPADPVKTAVAEWSAALTTPEA